MTSQSRVGTYVLANIEAQHRRKQAPVFNSIRGGKTVFRVVREGRSRK